MQAIIFDCDGTLADTMPAHYVAWTQMLTRHGFALSEDRFYALGGWPSEKIVALLAKEAGRTVDVAALTHEKEAAFLEQINHIRPIEPVLAEVLKHRGQLPIAVATGAMRSVCLSILRQIGLENAFDTVVSCEDVPTHKPHPEIYLEAARRLNVPPAECLVYEDTDPGVESARRAGMQVVDVRTFYAPRDGVK